MKVRRQLFLQKLQLLREVRMFLKEVDVLLGKQMQDRIGSVIYGLSVQKFGRLLEFRCIDCMRSKAFPFPMSRESGTTIRIYCETHPENFGQWGSEAELEKDKRELARRIGLL